jgi:hypothetical protein
MRLYVAFVLLALVTALLIPISASAQSDVDCVAIYDWNGVRVGRTHDTRTGAVAVLFDHEGRVAQIVLDRHTIRSTESVFFTDFNCTGDSFMRTRGQAILTAQVVGNDVWYPDMGAAELFAQPIESSQNGSGFCDNDGSKEVTEVVPAYTFTLPTFTPPFHLEPEACYTPDPSVAALTPYGLGAMAFVFAFGAYLMMQRGAGLGR